MVIVSTVSQYVIWEEGNQMWLGSTKTKFNGCFTLSMNSFWIHLKLTRFTVFSLIASKLHFDSANQFHNIQCKIKEKTNHNLTNHHFIIIIIVIMIVALSNKVDLNALRALIQWLHIIKRNFFFVVLFRKQQSYIRKSTAQRTQNK